MTIHENRPGLAWLVLPVVIGLLLRTIWALLVPVELVSDCSIYHTGATQIAAGNGFAFEDGSSNGYWPAGYSAFLSVFYRIFGSSVAVAVTVNVLLSTLFIASTAWLARSLFGSRTAAISAWVVALYPGLIAYTTAVASENLFLPLLTLIALAAVSPRVGVALLGGSAAVALAIAVRPTALLLPAIFFIGAFHLGLSWRAGVVRTLAVGALALVFCYPVAERNERIFGEFSYTSFNGGAVLWMGNHDGPPTTDLPEYVAALDVVERNAVLKQEAVEFIRAKPLLFARRSVERVITALSSETIPIVWNPALARALGDRTAKLAKLTVTVAWGLLFATSTVGFLVYARTRPWPILLLLTGVALNAIPFVLFDSQNRYHLPLLPFLFPVAAVALGRLSALRGGFEITPTRIEAPLGQGAAR